MKEKKIPIKIDDGKAIDHWSWFCAAASIFLGENLHCLDALNIHPYRTEILLIPNRTDFDNYQVF